MRTHRNYFMEGWKSWCVNRMLLYCQYGLVYTKEKIIILKNAALQNKNGTAIQIKKILFASELICLDEQNYRKQKCVLIDSGRDYLPSLPSQIKTVVMT